MLADFLLGFQQPLLLWSLSEEPICLPKGFKQKQVNLCFNVLGSLGFVLLNLSFEALHKDIQRYRVISHQYASPQRTLKSKHGSISNFYLDQASAPFAGASAVKLTFF